MPGLAHIVDDDASFLTAIERRLKQAGYEVNLPAESVPSCMLFDVRIPDLDGPGLAEATERTRLNAADHIPHRLSRHPGHRAGYQGRCG